MPKQNEQLPVTNEHERLVEKGRDIVIQAPQLLISVDIEADGRAGMGSLLAIGAVTPDETDGFYRELQPATDRFVPSQREFCEANGLSRDRLMREGNPARQAMDDFTKWIKSQEERTGKPAVLVGYAAGWDHGFIDYYYALHDQENPFGHASFDLKSRAMGLNGEWNWAQTGKNDLPDVLVPPSEFTHNALDDARWQQQIHFALAAYTLEQAGRA